MPETPFKPWIIFVIVGLITGSKYDKYTFYISGTTADNIWSKYEFITVVALFPPPSTPMITPMVTWNHSYANTGAT